MSPTARIWKSLTLGFAFALLGTALMAGRVAGEEKAAEHPNLQPGSWEISTEMEMPGMPARPPFTSTVCIKPDQIKDSKAFAETQQQRGGSCKVSDLKLESGKLSYSFACEHGNGSAELTFAGTSYEGTIKITTAGRGNAGPMTITQHIKAKRTGDC